MDEFGFYANEVPHFACSRKGCRAKIVQSGERGTHFTVIICGQNLVGQGEIKVSYKLIKNIRKKRKNKKKKEEKRGTNAVDLHDFIKGINFSRNKQCYILLDNAKIHHAIKSCIKAGRLPIKELAVEKGVILKYLPSHAPMIQPAELCVHFIKNFLKRERPKNDEEIENIIKQAIKDLRQRDLTE